MLLIIQSDYLFVLMMKALCLMCSDLLFILFYLNFPRLAPETQSTSKCSLLSDMFSLGMVICAVFNNGRPLIQAGNSTSNYAKQIESVGKQFLISEWPGSWVADWMDWMDGRPRQVPIGWMKSFEPRQNAWMGLFARCN